MSPERPQDPVGSRGARLKVERPQDPVGSRNLQRNA